MEGFEILMDKALAAFHRAAMPNLLWGEAVINANNTRNISRSTRSSDKTLYEGWFVAKLNILMICVFGCDSWDFIPKQ
jgi:hypothetical protein